MTALCLLVLAAVQETGQNNKDLPDLCLLRRIFEETKHVQCCAALTGLWWIHSVILCNVVTSL